MSADFSPCYFGYHWMSGRSIRRRLALALKRRDEHVNSAVIERKRDRKPHRNFGWVYIQTSTKVVISESERTYEPARQSDDAQHQANERSLAESTRTVANFTKALVFVGVISAVVSFFQWREMHNGGDDTHALAKAAETQADEIKKQSASIERSSTAGRAYLFVSYPINGIAVVAERSSTRFTVEIPFSIHNFGNTPAVITEFSTDFLVPDERFGGRSMPIPEPGTKLYESTKQDSIGGAIAVSGNNFGVSSIYNNPNYDKPLRIVIPAGGDTGVFKETFVYWNRDTAIISNTQIDGGWFFCKIKYLDIFGTERHTSFTIRPFATGFSYHSDPKYNNWD